MSKEGYGMSKVSSYIKTARINKCPLEFEALIDTGSDSVICRNSVAKRLELKIDPASNAMYGFGNVMMCAARVLGKAKVDISSDGVEVKGVEMLIVRDDALSHDLLIGRFLLDRENISFALIGNKFYIYYAGDNPFISMECEKNSEIKELKASGRPSSVKFLYYLCKQHRHKPASVKEELIPHWLSSTPSPTKERVVCLRSSLGFFHEQLMEMHPLRVPVLPLPIRPLMVSSTLMS
ncbi:CCHC-type domain-containing protein [Caerostris darwini]|uniref:CCHC-type domain-containing protein n=1 Tax=Caerostris darwini TaxID=1538125 RepID=A0AAV4P023_9ARAC|nr:CCHC-type domain-containing protein [Caerostris darwini]